MVRALYDERELSVDTRDEATAAAGQNAPIDHDDLVNKIIDTIVTEGMIDRDKVTPDATIESLDLKSIDIVMILTAIEDKFDVYIPMDGPFHDAKNVKDLIEAIANYIIKEKQAPDASR
jgi:acyl carrier protein